MLLLLIATGTGCKKGDPLSWDVEVSGPLMKTRLDLTDIIPDTILKGDCQNLAWLDFSQEVYRLSASSLVEVDQQIATSKYAIPVTVTMQPGQSFITSNEDALFQFEGAEIRTIVLDTGVVALKLTNPLTEPVECTWSLPKSDNGSGYFQTTTLIPAASGGNPGTVEMDVDLSGYRLSLTGKNNNSINRLQIRIDTKIAPNANPVLVKPSDTLRVEATFREFSLKEAWGYFGRHSVSTGKKIVPIRTFSGFTDGSITIDTASGTITVVNGIGMDIMMKFTSLVIRNTEKQLELVVTDPFVGKPVQMSRAAFNPSTGEALPTTYHFRFSKASMKAMLEMLPDEMEYEMEMETNPLGNVSFGNDFILAESPLTAGISLQMPFAFLAENLSLQSTAGIGFSSPEIHEATLYLIADNYFPFDATLSLTMLDNDGIAIDSVKPAGIVASGNLIQPDLLLPVRTVIPFVCNAERLGKLRKSRKIVLDIALDTRPSGTVVQFKTDYHMTVILTAHVNTTIDL